MPYCLLKNPLPWMLLLLGSAIFLGYGFSSIILTSILITLSNLMFNFFKHKQPPKPSFQSNHQEDVNDENKEDEDEEGKSKIMEVESRSRVMLSESECRGRSSTSEDSEVDYWQGNIFDNSDGSISDEDSLIEISLPSGVYIDHYNEELEEEKKKKKKRKLGDDSTADLYFKQQMSVVELLAEFNEDNLIEIDISMGSIKCPRFEIQA